MIGAQAERAAERAGAHFDAGFNCAESMALMANEVVAPGLVPGAPRVATALGRGMGAHHETCGALSGGILALGCLYGRDAPDRAAYTKARRAANRFRDLFLQSLGATNCGDLRTPAADREDAKKRCRRITATAAALLVQVISEDGDPLSKPTP